MRVYSPTILFTRNIHTSCEEPQETHEAITIRVAGREKEVSAPSGAAILTTAARFSAGIMHRESRGTAAINMTIFDQSRKDEQATQVYGCEHKW